MNFRMSYCVCLLVLLGMSWNEPLQGQRVAVRRIGTTSVPSTTPTEIPRFISFNGLLKNASGKPLTAPVDVTFALYREQSGGEQVWRETQKVAPDATGKYSVLLGSTNPYGVPQSTFTGGEARWLGITVNGVEQPRVMLLSVPYAMKAGDAETLGGLPASAFMQSISTGSTGTSLGSQSTTTPQRPLTSTDGSSTGFVLGSGTQNYLPLWLGGATLGSSTAYQSGTNVGVGRTVLIGDGISPINVMAFGAKGDGVTDDTAAIASAIAAIPATGGQLYFPPGKYITSGGFNITVPTVIFGAGQASRDNTQFGSEIVSTSPTAPLFNVTAKVGLFRDLALVSTAAAPTSSTAILTNSTYSLARISIESVSVNGFYDDIHQSVGSSWYIVGSHIQNPVRYGIYIQNTVNNDDGDWILDDNYIEGGPLTNGNTAVAINIESSGGGKISNNKINATFNNGIRINVTISGQTLISNNDIENVTGPPINIVHGWPYITIVGNYLLSVPPNPCIYASFLNGFYIGSNLLETNQGVAIPYAVVIDTAQVGTIGPNTINFHFTAPTKITNGVYVNDQSSVTSSSGTVLSGPQTINFASTTNPGLTIDNTASTGDASITFQNTWNGTVYNSSIASNWYGNGMTFTLPRTLTGKGFFFNNADGKNLMFIDSVTGSVNIPAGASYTVAGQNVQPLAAVTTAIGGSQVNAGACTSSTVTVTGATTSMVAQASPVTFPGAGFQWNAYVSAANTVTVNVCATAASGTPTATAYNVRVVE